MRILLVAPEQFDLNQNTEIRSLSEMHEVNVYCGTVTELDLYEACRKNYYDVIHVASHLHESKENNTPSTIVLSNGDELLPHDLVSLSQWCGAKLLFINTCNSHLFATYAARRGIPGVIYTNKRLDDRDAWKVPLGFYTYIKRMEDAEKPVDYHTAYLDSAPDDGLYGWSSSDTEYQRYLISPILDRLDEFSEELRKMRQDNEEHMATLTRNLEEHVLGIIQNNRRTDAIILSVIALIILIASVIPDIFLFRMAF